MPKNLFDQMRVAIAGLAPHCRVGRVSAVAGGTVACDCGDMPSVVGDRAVVHAKHGPIAGEVVRIERFGVHILLDGPASGIAVHDAVTLQAPDVFAPHDSWIGRVIDPDGKALDSQVLLPGFVPMRVDGAPPPAHNRRPMGGRLETGMAVFNTLLPIVEGQRLGLFAGSGVGKSTLIADLAKRVQADVIVIALVGERGREVGHFVQDVLGPKGMAKSVVVAATSDSAPQYRRKCALSAMAVAEYFRDQGRHVLLLVDSVTRFCEAHREVAAAQGETANLRGFPASTAAAVAGLCERAGPGAGASGNITAVFSVLVAGSDMEEPIADMLRGMLDGHIVLDRDIAERGRFPAIDVVRSVSRALPEAASAQENKIVAQARRLMADYAQSALMIQSGLYEAGADPAIDAAVRCHAGLEDFLAVKDERGTLAHFAKLRQATTSSAMKQEEPARA